jgi:hypothetical protein
MKKFNFIGDMLLLAFVVFAIGYFVWQFGRSYGRTEGLRIGNCQPITTYESLR